MLGSLTAQHHAELAPLFSAYLQLSDPHSSIQAAEKHNSGLQTILLENERLLYVVMVSQMTGCKSLICYFAVK